MSRAAGAGDDRQLIEAFLEMLAAEAGAARNTLLAYRRDLKAHPCC
jgi:integrase/recombinase XerD